MRSDSTTSRVAFVANWVLFNFRLSVARALRVRGCEVLLVCPPGQLDVLVRGRGPAAPTWVHELFPGPDLDGEVPVVSVLDGHSHALAWLGALLGVPHVPLGVDAFGQSGARADLYRHYGIDPDAIAQAARLLLA